MRPFFPNIVDRYIKLRSKLWYNIIKQLNYHKIYHNNNSIIIIKNKMININKKIEIGNILWNKKIQILFIVKLLLFSNYS